MGWNLTSVNLKGPQGETGSGSGSTGAVEYDQAQSLTNPEKQQARTNIGLGNANDTSDATKDSTASTLSSKTIGNQLDFTSWAVGTAPATPSSGARFFTRQGTSALAAPAWVNTVGIPMVIGRDIGVFAKNNTGAAINLGTAVYVSSASGSQVNIAKAQSNSTFPVLGIVAKTIPNGEFGLVLQYGVINNMNTSSLSANSPIFVDPVTAGLLTTTPPVHPNVSTSVGMVINTSASVGAILVNCNQVVPNATQGVNGSSFSIGDGTTTNARTILFKNTSTGTLSWQPSAARTLTLPDVTGTVATTANLATFAYIVPVTTGSEARPAGATYVQWVDVPSRSSTTQPTNMTSADIWMKKV